jgi:Tol biopolymer transport system component/predicted Ser/Thr protein kinase
VLKTGTRLGPYEVTGSLGAGGMGEVYKARDTNLNRDVAIKVVPELFARDPERLTRFTREAQTLASLNHPNVAQVFGVERQALVMEFVDGEDLAQRIARGAVPIDDAIDVARQIACGLEAAHERGIVHRDLKPANVRITPDGTVKVLDFGLAKALDPAGGSGPMDALNSPTFTSPATELGMIIGTAAYMAPEQARGKPVDKRADIWAFGCVVYEMLSAKRPFKGETVTDTLAAIVKEEPDWSALPPATPPALRRLIANCLVKDPKQRLRDIGDARIALERIVAGAAEERVGTAPAGPAPRGRFGIAHVAIAALLLAAIASLVTWRVLQRSPETPRPVARFVIPLGYEVLPLRSNGTGVAYSPDGTSVVYAGQPVLLSSPVLYRRKLHSLEVERIPKTEGAYAPFFSPDGRWIGFFTDQAVMKLSVEDGSLSKICERGSYSRADWAPDDTILLGTGQANAPGSLGKVPASGGTAVALTKLVGKESVHQLPHVLPDGGHAIFTVVSPERSELAIASLDDGSHQLLDLEGSGGMFVPPNHLLFARGDLMYGVPFDRRSRRVTGPAVQVLENAGVYAGGMRISIPQIGVDRNGSVAYLSKGGTASVLGWMSPGSTFAELAIPEAVYASPKISPDGRRAAVVVGQAPPDIWVVDLARGTRLRLTSTGGTSPIWSPDGSRVAYASVDTGIMSIAADGSGMPEVLTSRQGQIAMFPTSWSPDGKIIAIQSQGRSAGQATRNRDIWMLRLGEKPVPFLTSPSDERGGDISPNGQWLAYASSVSGREEIYLRALGGAGGTIPVSTSGGTLPRWSASGDALYFLAAAPTRMVRVSVSGTPPQIGTPVTVASLPAAMNGLDVAADGRLLIAQQKASAGSIDALHILLNWGASLR